MNNTEIMKLVNEYGLKWQLQRLTYKGYIIADSYYNSSDEICLDFIGINYNIDNYEEAKKYTEERIKIVKELIITIKKAELENDFQ